MYEQKQFVEFELRDPVYNFKATYINHCLIIQDQQMLTASKSPHSRPLITRKQNPRKLRIRSALQYSHNPPSLETQSPIWDSSQIQIERSKPPYKGYPEISQLKLSCSRQQPAQNEWMLSSRLKFSKIEVENDRLRSENQQLRREVKELKQLLQLKTQQQQSKFLEWSQSTVLTQAHSQQQQQEHIANELENLKQICERLRQDNYALKRQIQAGQFDVLMLHRKIDFKSKTDYCKAKDTRPQNRDCKRCRDLRQLKARNRTLNNLVLSLSERLNNFSRSDEDQLFRLSPD